MPTYGRANMKGTDPMTMATTMKSRTGPRLEIREVPLEPDHDLALAAELAGHAIDLEPENGWWWRSLAMAHYRLGELQAAADEHDKSFELLGTTHAWGRFYQAMAYWQLGNKDEAQDWYARAVKGIPTGNWSHPNLNGELYQLQREAAALLGIDDADAEQPESVAD